MFENIIQDVKTFIRKKQATETVTEFHASSNISWPEAGGRDIILLQDVGTELGNPRDGSTSFLVWTEDLTLVHDGCITLIGPDIGELYEKHMPFGKVVMVGATGFDAENSYERYRQLELLRHDISLQGYMIRAVPQHMREWSRVSKEAVRNGFSLSLLGSALTEKFRELDYVKAVEVLMVTSSDAIDELKKISEKATKFVSAMTKMVEDMSLDCDSCEYQTVCQEVTSLRAIREKSKKGQNLFSSARQHAG